MKCRVIVKSCFYPSNGSKAAVESPSQSALVARNFEQNNMYLLTGWEGLTGKYRSDSRSVRASGMVNGNIRDSPRR